MAKKATQPSDYKHIRAWGKILGSYEYYIENEQQKAFDLELPLDTIYISTQNEGRSVNEIKCKDTLARVQKFAQNS